MLEKKTSRLGLVISLVLTAVLIATGLWALFNREYIIDQVTVWNYDPSVEIETINGQLLFTDEGTFRFYVTKPTIEGSDTFNLRCPQQEENNPILGCYTGDRIYIYDVENESLEGIKQVTAAHEMLHSAWDRLSPSDKKQVISLLEAEHESISDQSFIDRMEYYERTEPGQFYNELHSIIGTEFESISKELEEYYKRYFADRQVVVNFSEQYNEIFKSLRTKADDLVLQLENLSAEIDQDRTDYENRLAILSADIDSFNERADNGDFESQSEFNSERSALLSRSSDLEQTRAALNQKINTYNEMYNRYQDVASEIQQLNKSIDSESAVPEPPNV